MASGTLWGNTVQGVWQAYAKWSDSSTNTTFTMNLTTGMRSLAWGINVHGLYADASINNQTNSGSSYSFYSANGATVDKDFVSKSITVSRTHSTQTISAHASVVNNSGYKNGRSDIYTSWTVPAKPSYKVSYNANGGSGAPSDQTKWYGENLTLSSTKPTRTGYTFAGWNTNSSGTGTNYSSGGTYTGNAAVTLYAKWTAITYTVSYNANGGTGAPGNQTKTYGKTLTLSSTRPTRTNYNFKGWATSSTATSAQYQPGGSFTTNATTTLYAVWQLAYVAPRITNLAANRCNSAGTYTEDGTYAKITFNWATDRSIAVGAVKIVCNGTTYTASGTSGTSGSVTHVVGAGALSTENSYTVTVTVTDSGGSSTSTTTLAPLAYIMDFSPEGGVGIGTPAPASKRFDVGYPIVPRTYIAASRSIVGTNGVVGPWIKIGEWQDNGQGNVVIVRVYGGNGQNGDPYQNTIMTIYVKKGWTGQSDGKYFGGYVGVENVQSMSDINVRLLQIASNRCELWCYFNWTYDVAWVSVECSVGTTWKDGSNTHSSSTPSNGTACDVEKKRVITTDGNSENVTLKGHIYLPNYGAIAGALTSGSYSTMLRMNTSNQVELTWTSGGLRGRVMKQIWSGTWNTGSITVSELPYYNMIAFTTIANAPYLFGIGLRMPGSSHWTLFNVNARTDDGLVFNAINAVQNNTTLTISKNAHAIWRTSSSTVSNGTDGSVYKIYGVL